MNKKQTVFLGVLFTLIITSFALILSTDENLGFLEALIVMLICFGVVGLGILLTVGTVEFYERLGRT